MIAIHPPACSLWIGVLSSSRSLPTNEPVVRVVAVCGGAGSGPAGALGATETLDAETSAPEIPEVSFVESSCECGGADDSAGILADPARSQRIAIRIPAKPRRTTIARREELRNRIEILHLSPATSK
jgi:hypothetical protein